MAKIRLTTKGLDKAVKSIQDRIRKIRKDAIDSITAKRVGDEIVRLMKSEIKSGKSPIAGKGGFPAYRGSYRERIQRTGKINGFNKSLQPVNLKVSGQMLRNLKPFVLKTLSASGFQTIVGYRGTLAQQKEKGHREGVNGQARRPTIPQDDERFNRKINKRINEIYLKRLNQLLKKI